jgi:histidine decarboxylase
MPSLVVRADDSGQMDYDDLAEQLVRHGGGSVVVVATAGTTMTEAVDDTRRIHTVLDAAKVRNRFVHVDAALAGIPLALVDPHQRPGFDFTDGADTVAVSGHKFLGCPFPCGIVVARSGHRGVAVDYLDSLDTTISGSRSGHTPLMLWHALTRHGIEGLRARATSARDLAAYTTRRLTDLGWEAWRHDHAFTVVLKTPPAAVTDRWVLASTHDGWSHIICMPGVTRTQIDGFVHDLATSIGRHPQMPAVAAPLSAHKAAPPAGHEQ